MRISIGVKRSISLHKYDLNDFLLSIGLNQYPEGKEVFKTSEITVFAYDSISRQTTLLSVVQYYYFQYKT